MSFQLREIVLYSRRGKVRRLRFRMGSVNVITGRSGTGKSALIPILDYCLGRSTFTIPEGVIRDSVAWYAVILTVRNGTEVFVAKPAPSPSASSQSQAMITIGSNLEPPLFGDLVVNSNDEAVEAMLSRELGISPNLHTPQAGQSRDALSANISHTKFYIFQEQGLIANRDLLFFRQSEQFIPQAIKDTLPYLLGAVEEDHLAGVEELRRLRREIKLLERDVMERTAIVGGGIARGQALVSEGIQAGLTGPIAIPSTAADVRRVLQDLEGWRPQSVPEVGGTQRGPQLRTELKALQAELRDLGEAEQAARAFADSASNYGAEATEQASRLESIHVFGSSVAPPSCPFCGTKDIETLPRTKQLEARLTSLAEHLALVSQQRPRLQEYLSANADHQLRIRQAIREKQTELASVDREDARAEAIADQNSRAARAVGRISLYLESAYELRDDDQLSRTLNTKRQRVALLEKIVSDADEQEILTSILNRLGADMTGLASSLPFEHHNHPLRFDLQHLTVVADRPGRPFTMQRMGSGQNWLVCHLVTLLALHRHFRQAKRPVPAILILDQPSQVYFPSEEGYRNSDGTIENTETSGADLSAVKQMFALIFDVVSKLLGEMQIIVLEHANLDSEQYQDALVEERWDGEVHALVPPTWAEDRS
jgi:hypothetical protein